MFGENKVLLMVLLDCRWTMVYVVEILSMKFFE
jgi:hypothetical protein